MSTKLEVSIEERDLILAALRLYQDTLEQYRGAMFMEIQEIATNGGLHEALNLEAIDALCERINT